jgi:hypothetical protein
MPPQHTQEAQCRPKPIEKKHDEEEEDTLLCGLITRKKRVSESSNGRGVVGRGARWEAREQYATTANNKQTNNKNNESSNRKEKRQKKTTTRLLTSRYLMPLKPPRILTCARRRTWPSTYRSIQRR